jgi:hypothetical protein
VKVAIVGTIIKDCIPGLRSRKSLSKNNNNNICYVHGCSDYCVYNSMRSTLLELQLFFKSLGANKYPNRAASCCLGKIEGQIIFVVLDWSFMDSFYQCGT